MATKKAAAKKKAPAKKAPAKKAVAKKAAAAPKKSTPIADKLTKGQIVASIADSVGLSKKQIGSVMDELHSLIERSIKRSRARAKPVSVCGEMAGDPQFTRALLGMGLRSFSMHPAQIGSVKQQVLRADTRKTAAHAGV